MPNLMLRQPTLTKKLILSGISRVAIPSRKDKDEMEVQFGNVLVLHLQCKDIAVLTIGALDAFHSLKNLYLYKNSIRRIQGLDYLCNLELLDLSRNNIERIDNLDKCKKLKKLYLGFNEIQVVEGLDGLLALEEFQVDDQDIPPGQPLIFSPGIMASIFHSLIILDISSNQLSTLVPIANLPLLDTLDASGNCLSNAEEVIAVLQTLYQLRNLNLKGNPMSKKPTYKSNVIGAVYRLEFLDEKEIHDTVRSSVQKLRQMREYRNRHKQKTEERGDSSKSVEESSHPSDFSFTTPTRLSPISLAPLPKPFKLKKKGQVAPVATGKLAAPNDSLGGFKLKATSSGSDPSLLTISHSQANHKSSSNVITDCSMYTTSARHSSIQASEFKDEFSLDYDDDGMSDMAKIIFRLSNLDDPGAGNNGGGDARAFHSSYWDLPGSSMIRECRPLSPLEGIDLAEPYPAPGSMNSPELTSGTTAAATMEEKKSSGSFRPKPAAPGGRRCSNNATNNATPTTKSATELLARTLEDDQFLQQSQQNYVYGRTLSPLIELPTPESLTARDENN